MMEVNRITVGGFLDLVKPLRLLPPDTPFTIGIGNSTFDPDIDDSLAASARRELVRGDALYELPCVALTVARRTEGGLQARLCLDSEWGTYRGYKEWREYVYTEALALGIIEPADGAGDNNPKTKSHDHKEEEHPSPRAADPDPGWADCPPGSVHAAARGFDPDRDAIGI